MEDVLSTREFLDNIFQESEGWICGWFYHKANDKKKEAAFEIGPGKNGIESLIANAEVASSKGWDCYYVPSVFNSGRRTKEHWSHSNVLWADFDSGDGLPSFETEPSLVVQSSPGKYHAYWNLHNSITDRDQLELLNKGLAYSFGADKSGWDAVQLLRIPGTFNYKYFPPEPVILDKCRLVSYDINKFVPFLMGSLIRAHQQLLHPSAFRRG